MLKILFPLLCLLLCVGSMTAADGPGVLDKVDADFVHKASQANLFEVRSSEIALKRLLTADEKEFAQMMIDDHKKANKELDAIALKKGITLPNELDSKHQEKVEKLSKADDKDFPEAYFEGQVSAHKKAIDLFEKESKDGKDVDLKAFAISALPTLRNHLEHAKRCESKY